MNWIHTTKYLLQILLVWCVACGMATAQINKMYSVEDGLSSSLITCTFQDKRGFVWIGTEYGLNRFDGNKFAVYKQSSNDLYSINNNHITVIFESSSGFLLVGTASGLSHYKYEINAFENILFQYKGRMVQPRVVGVVEIENGDFWVATNGHGMFVMKPYETVARHEPNITAMLGGKDMTVLLRDANRNLWLGNLGTLNRYSFVLQKSTSYTFDDVVVSLLEDHAGRIYVALRNATVLKYNPTADALEPIPNMQHDRYLVNSLYANPYNILFVCTEGQGLRFYNSATGQIEMYENPAIGIKINHSKVRSVMRDKMNDLWLGIYQEGVYFSHMVSKNFSYYGKHSLSNNVIGYHAVQSVCKDSEGNMWVGTDGDGLYRVNLANNAVRHYEASEVAGSVSGTVSSLYNDSKGTLWVGSHDKGLTWINRSTGVCTAIPKLAKEKISYIGENHQKELLVGTRGAGVYVLSMETHEITHHYESSKLEVPDYIVDELCNDWINHVLCDSKGLLWIGHDMGLSCYDPVKKTFLRYHSSNNLLPGNTVHALCEDKQGCIWIGTTTQLYRMDKLSATFESVPINNTSSGDMICGILEDQSNNLWISTYKGLCKLAVASRKCNTYYASDGLQGDEFTIGVAYVDRRDGQYFFGGTNGITVFSPASVAVTPNQSVPVITALTLSNKQTSVPSEGAVFHLADNDNSFTVEFSQMDYLNASKAVYQYRMEGLSDEWRFTHAGGNQVSYGHVPPGRYTFTVRLVDRSSGESATSITIIVGRDMTVLVYVLLLLAGLVVAGGAVWLWHRQKKKEGAKKTSSYVSNFEI